MAALVDSNVLVYVFDPDSPRKQRLAARLLERGFKDNSLRIAHQAIAEFVAAVTRTRANRRPLLQVRDACREAEEFVNLFEVLYPTEELLRLALRGLATYQFAWWDAHMWAYAEYFGLSQLLTEDFEHNRLYGTVRAINPFL